MDAQTLLGFAAAFFVFAGSPGPDNMTIVARTVSHGAQSGIAYGMGTVAGIVVYLGLAFFGLSLMASEMGLLMTVLRYAGAAYLLWMGVRLWMAEPVVPALQPMHERQGLLPVFLTGVALNLGNPKMPLFYLALLPNFVSDTAGLQTFLALVAVIMLVEVVVIGGHVWLATRARRLLRTPAIVRRANRITGSFLAAAGLAIVATRR